MLVQLIVLIHMQGENPSAYVAHDGRHNSLVREITVGFLRHHIKLQQVASFSFFIFSSSPSSFFLLLLSFLFPLPHPLLRYSGLEPMALHMLGTGSTTGPSFQF